MGFYGTGEVIEDPTSAGDQWSITKNKTISKPTSAAAVYFKLPAAAAVNDYTNYVVKDGKGDAATNNILITPVAGDIDGATTVTINANYGALVFTSDGTNWHLI